MAATVGSDSQPGATFDEMVDHVIVGSGAGAVIAALVAVDAGQSVVILEKQERFGGSTGYSGGVLWIPNNPVMAREGIEDSYERSRVYLDAAVRYDGPGTTPTRRKAFLTSGPEMVRYLESKGMRFERTAGYADYFDELPGGEPRSRSLAAPLFNIRALGEWRQRLSVYPLRPLRISAGELSKLVLVKTNRSARVLAAKVAMRMVRDALRRRDVRGAGGALQGRLLALALEASVPIRLQTPVVDFVCDGDTVTGVVVSEGGRPRRIGARHAVLLNAGGYSHNARLRQVHGPSPNATPWTLANPGDTGELLEAAVGLGAATDAMDEHWWSLTSLGPGETFPHGTLTKDGQRVPFSHHFDITLPHVILVDQDGRRFVNESTNYMEHGQRLYARHRETGRGIPAWAIIESRHRRRYLWGSVMGRTPRQWLRSGYMKQANTLEDLARQCEIDPVGLRQTVERFNGFCLTGVDEEYGRGARAFDRYHGDPAVRPNPNLGMIERPPFYAVAIYPTDIGSAGGLVTDADGRVLDESGAAIEGLYATGNSTASVMGRSYPGAGASIAASCVFAYRAALHATRRPASDGLLAAAT